MSFKNLRTEDKRIDLVAQCREHRIPARLGGLNRNGKRNKPTTLGRMRRLLEAKGIKPRA